MPASPLPPHSIHADEPPRDPIALITAWLAAPEPPALMTLSTIGEDGWPAARTALLSRFADGAIRFHTDAASRKAAELATDPRVALTVVWPDGGRQLVVQGVASPEGDADRSLAYRERSPYLRELAWLNTPEYAALPLVEREARWAAFAAENPDPAPPPTWAGYAVEPHRLLFWERHTAAAGRRLEFRRDGEGWIPRVLPG